MAHVRVIPDDKSEIINNIKELSLKYSLIFTSGGIGKINSPLFIIVNPLGPTHDDITYDSIAEAFNFPLIEHVPTIKSMLYHYKTEVLNKGQLRMATIPQSESVFQTPGLWVPLVQTKNVLIFPGVPLLFKRMIDNWFEKELHNFIQKGKLTVSPRMRISVKTSWKESDIAERLAELQKSVNKFDIALGSYPKLFEDGSTFVIVSISGSLELRNEIEKISLEISDSFDGDVLEESK